MFDLICFYLFGSGFVTEFVFTGSDNQLTEDLGDLTCVFMFCRFFKRVEEKR